jgi:hypothetical protein
MFAVTAPDDADITCKKCGGKIVPMRKAMGIKKDC